ncbi:hypothetical protein MNBD_GAMMA05-1691 [hydrothermal vent metagenome]|uniref:Rhodanese domain-containing protein n=1 Tax=hydrothermal vent metagenome TaxID=652676 RepID=A0A3B0XEE9_9ZZZZ
MRSLQAKQFMTIKKGAVLVIDIRRESDYDSSEDVIPGAAWKDPEKVEEWMGSLPTEEPVIVYCVRGGGISNSVVDKLQANNVDARFIEGGIEGLKEAGGLVERK